MVQFDLSDLNPNLTDDMRLKMADVILAWAAYDTAVSYWVTLAFGLPMDAGSIVLGTMDTRNKLDKLKALYLHFGHDKSAASISRLSKGNKHFAEIRNTICHQKCSGHLRSDPDYIVFHSIRHVKGSPSEFEIVSIPTSDMYEVVKFARSSELKIRQVTDAMTGPIAKSRPHYSAS